MTAQGLQVDTGSDSHLRKRHCSLMEGRVLGAACRESAWLCPSCSGLALALHTRCPQPDCLAQGPEMPCARQPAALPGSPANALRLLAGRGGEHCCSPTVCSLQGGGLQGSWGAPVSLGFVAPGQDCECMQGSEKEQRGFLEGQRGAPPIPHVACFLAGDTKGPGHMSDTASPWTAGPRSFSF